MFHHGSVILRFSFLGEKSNLESLHCTVQCIFVFFVILILDPKLESKYWIPDYPGPRWITDPRSEINRADAHFFFRVKFRIGAN